MQGFIQSILLVNQANLVHIILVTADKEIKTFITCSSKSKITVSDARWTTVAIHQLKKSLKDLFQK